MTPSSSPASRRAATPSSSGTAEGGSASGTNSSKAAKGQTCDNCRKRKIKCVDGGGGTEPCVGCRNLQIDCTYDYVRKKPGRKNSFALALKKAQAQRRQQEEERHNEHSSSIGRIRQSHLRQSYTPYEDSVSRTDAHSTRLAASPLAGQQISSSPMSSILMDGDYDSVHSSAVSSSIRGPYGALHSSRPSPGNGGLSWLDSISMVDTTILGPGIDFGFDVGSGTTQLASEQARLLSLESPETILPQTSGTRSIAALQEAAALKEPQLEDVTSWANISHYISLYLQFLYPILPLVHRPTFAENLATRLDLRDADFRALLLSIVAFTISQLPTSRLTTDVFDVEGLKHLQRKCHRASQALQRTYHGQVTLTQICIIIFDNFYLLSIGLTHTAAAKLGEAVQLAFSLGIHSDSRTAALGLDPVEVQLRRRVFWQLYASDKTRAIPGNPMLINDFQGVCSYPEAVDDDFITSQGMFPQPPARTSFLVGFVAVSKLFRILSECFFHHRCILSDMRSISLEWTTDAEDRVHQLLNQLPEAIQDPNTVRLEASRQVFATQRANILITAAIVKFALYDLRSALDVSEEQLGRERETIAREIHGLLMSIPVEDLASNGESVRGKVFHIACALCGQVSTPGTDTDLVRDWCDMFSAITFVQMPLPPPDTPLDDRVNAPPHSESNAATG